MTVSRLSQVCLLKPLYDDARHVDAYERLGASYSMSLFRGCFSPRKAARGSATKSQPAFNKGVLEDRWKQYDNLSKESTLGQVPVCFAPHRKVI